ncbi:MAG: efflux RND transporter periplasmic adaptor subunit [Proteobacteria bacterium]|nr:efflux RND transporter periplasmic adaptor subunit [Pseudomonadota bacterium]
MRDFSRATLAVAAVLLVAGVGVAGCGQKPAAAPTNKTALTVTAAVVETTPLNRTVNASGTVAAWQEVIVASETGGLNITAVLVDEGSHVREGQQLIQLDDRVLRAQVRQSEAGVASAKAVLAQQSAALKRAQELKAKGFLAQSALDTAVANEKTASAQVLTAEAGLGEAQAKLSQASVRAPVSGLITSRTAVKGNVINVGAELFRLVRDDQVELNAQIPEADLPYVHAGMAASVHGPQGSATGRVRVVTPQVDPQTRLGLARITLPVGSPFRPGNFATASIDVGALPALSVPEGAVVYRDGKPGVYTLDANNRAHFTPIVTGNRLNGMVQVTAGLQSGTRIVTSGGGFLSDGDHVSVVAAIR